MKKNGLFVSMVIAIGFTVATLMSCSDVNTVEDPHFSADGFLLKDSNTSDTFSIVNPTKIKYYVEVSGSMNGFFRPNQPTQFKTDVWGLMSYFSALPSEVTILTNNGSIGSRMSIDEFRKHMNTGSFISSASTQVPIMLSSIVDDIKPDKGEVAVLISDMKYSPVGVAAPKVLM